MWCEEKKQEEKETRNNEAREDADYAKQTDAITRFRGLCEDENTQKRLEANKALQLENKKLA